MEASMEALLSVCLGIGLAAACGFRIFVPFLVMSVAARSGHLDLAYGFDWIGTNAAMGAFAVAAALEIGAYFVPWLDNLLDTMATPTAVVAGVLATAATIDGTSPLVAWSLAVIGGGGIAGVIQTSTAVLRGASTVMTGGFGNPLVSTAEAGGAVGLAAVAVMVPVVALLVILTLVLYAGTRTAQRVARSRALAAEPVAVE